MPYRNKDSNFFRKAQKEKVRVYWENLKKSKKWVVTTLTRGKKRPKS